MLSYGETRYEPTQRDWEEMIRDQEELDDSAFRHEQLRLWNRSIDDVAAAWGELWDGPAEVVEVEVDAEPMPF